MNRRLRLTEPPTVQCRLVVGPANDRYEREADRVAKQVINRLGSGGPGTARATDSIARVAMDEEEEPLQAKRIGSTVVGADGGAVDADLGARIESARRGGQPMEPQLRRSMEGAFGADFSGVKMHVGPASDRLNHDLGARAFTHHRDVFVRGDDFRPGTRAGRELLAHELTHVVQQGGAPIVDRTDT